MIDKNNEYSAISPYTDDEAREAFERLSKSPLLPIVSRFFFPKESIFTLSKLLKEVHSIDDFQEIVMDKIITTIIEYSCSGFTYDGLDNIGENKYLAVSNHRDIILDPAFVQWTLLHNNKQMTEICVGSNLLGSNPIVDDLLRSNRMIKVIRGISARELYLSSKLLSGYIRECITSDSNSVWIAQREGRTKNGLDSTEQGLLKMFDMSGGKDFMKNFMDLNIIPMSISYEYESCDMRKARELLISRSRKYVKRRGEDTKSIMSGMKQWKGGVHLHIDEPLTEDEIAMASACGKNDRYQSIRQTLDRRIIRGYKLWKTNYMGYDLMTGGSKYYGIYSPADMEEFKAYTEHKLNKVEFTLDRNALRQIFWEIYGNPVLAKEKVL